MTQGSMVENRTWRVLIDSFLAQLLDATQCSYAAFVDTSIGRERYVFASQKDPLPDIDWRSLMASLRQYVQIKPQYCVLHKDTIPSERKYAEISQHFDTRLFDVIVCVPLKDGTRLLGIACALGSIPPADLSGLRDSVGQKVEGLAQIASIGLSALVSHVANNGEQGIHQEALRRLPEGLLMADGNGIVIESNDAFSTLTGIPPESLTGRNLKDQPILGTDCDYLVARLLESGQPFEVIARLGAGDSQDDEDISGAETIEGKFLRLRGSAYPEDTTPPAGMLLLADDVTRDVLSRREANRRERRHSQEIELASRLQQNFFPSNYQKKRIRIATRLIAARELAGDFFDIFDLGPNTIGLIVGDVVGKGIPGSLMAMSVHGMLANQAGALTPPMKVLERVNEALYQQVKGEYWYATCFYAKIHVTQLRMTFSRAGHELPLWWHKETGQVTFLEGEGLPLGIFPDSRYVTLQIDLGEGDRLLFYTDGLIDATSPAGERFGHDRLVELFRKSSSLGSKNLIKVIENEVKEFQGSREQLDDIALALLTVVPDSWTAMAIPPYTFTEVMENLLDELRLRGVDEDALFKVRLSLDECVTNAFRHGHRGDERRQITISYLVEADKLILKVRDQGPGFDFGMIPDPTLMENLMHPGGRGVFLTLKMMDEVSFNDVGNEVTMVKRLHKSAEKPKD